MSKQEKKTVVPKLRFAEFKKAKGWEIKSLGEHYSFKTTNSLTRDKLNYEKGLVKNIHYGDIHTKFSTLFNIEKENVPFINQSESLEKIKLDNYCIEGDIIFADASEDVDDIGKSIEIVQLNNQKLLSGLHTILARPINQELIIGFGGYLFKSDKIRNQIKKEAQGAKVLGISPARLSNIKINFPTDKKEQQKITDCLSSIDDLITLQAQKIENLKNHKKGLMQQLFPIEGKTVPKLRFVEFQNAKHWTEGTIGKRCQTFSGGTPSTTKKDYYGGNIPFIRSAEIDKTYTELFLTNEGLNNSSAKLIKKGDILFALYGANSGEVALAKQNGAINQAILCLRSESSNIFIYQFLLFRKNKIINKYIQGGQGNLSGEIVKSINLPLPKPKEQQKIADCLSSLDELINAESQKLDIYKNHKKGLMQQLFPSMDEVTV